MCKITHSVWINTQCTKLHRGPLRVQYDKIPLTWKILHSRRDWRDWEISGIVLVPKYIKSDETFKIFGHRFSNKFLVPKNMKSDETFKTFEHRFSKQLRIYCSLKNVWGWPIKTGWIVILILISARYGPYVCVCKVSLVLRSEFWHPLLKNGFSASKGV